MHAEHALGISHVAAARRVHGPECRPCAGLRPRLLSNTRGNKPRRVPGTLQAVAANTASAAGALRRSDHADTLAKAWRIEPCITPRND
jgi:hypothetical protein